MKDNIFWDATGKTIRGSFVNLTLTISFLSVILFAILTCNKEMVQCLLALQNLMVWFFGLSFGLWSGKKVFDNVFSSTSVTAKSSE